MVTKSGIILDYDSNLGVSGAVVHVFTTTGTSSVASGVCSPIGTFTVEIPPTVGSDLVFIPAKQGCKGYTRQMSKNISFLNLYVRTTPATANADNLNLTLYNTGLVTSTVVRDIIATPAHYYIITDNGLDVIDVNTLYNVAYAVRSGGYSAITLDRTIASASGVYLGTSDSGVYRFSIPEYGTERDIASNISVLYNITLGNIQSNTVNCLSLNSKGELGVGTVSGIDFYTVSGRKQFSYSGTGISGTTAIAVSEYGDIYYSPTNSGLHVKYHPVSSNWNTPDYVAVLSGTGAYPFPLLTNYINNIAITSVSGDSNNQVFLATLSGLVYFQEDINLNVSASGAKLFRSLP